MSETQKQSHPKGLYLLFFTEMWERFSYYGMRAILILFLTKQLYYDKAFASNGIFGSFTGLVYLTPIIGGFIADRYWGNRRSIIFGGILMAIGQLFLFASGSMENSVDLARMAMFVGLGFLIVGNGFFKPNISTMVGQLYPANDKRIDSAFTIFYMGINLGAFFAPLICGYLGENVDFKWGFLAAGIGMIISTISFHFLKSKYLISPTGEQIGTKPSGGAVKNDDGTEIAAFSGLQIGLLVGGSIVLFLAFFYGVGFDFFGSLIFSLAISIPATIIVDRSLTKVEKERIWVIYIAAFFVVFFWSAFEQAGSSLTYFADEQTKREIFGWTMPASWFQSFNAVFIVLLAPVVSMVWVRLGKAGKEPASPFKQAIGLFLLAVGYFYIAIGVKGVPAWEKVSMVWLVGLYLLHTFGELCLSPIGLSMVNKLAPVRFASLLMGVWFLANATANKCAGMLGAFYPEEQNVENVYKVNPDVLKTDWNIVIKDSTVNLNKKWKVELVKSSSKVEKADSVASITLDSSLAKTDTIKIKRVIGESDVDAKEKKVLLRKHLPLPKFVYGLDESPTKMWVLKYDVEKKKAKMMCWNLNPNKPKLLGMEIKNLYDFFMIFVFMAGAASIALFFISKKLVKMMNGVR